MWKRSWPILRYYTGISLEGLRENKEKNFVQVLRIDVSNLGPANAKEQHLPSGSRLHHSLQPL
jgi:hypothetical protein